jgi:hypothetical protein
LIWAEERVSGVKRIGDKIFLALGDLKTVVVRTQGTQMLLLSHIPGNGFPVDIAIEGVRLAEGCDCRNGRSMRKREAFSGQEHEHPKGAECERSELEHRRCEVRCSDRNDAP